jgi:hypothetical protein
MTSEITSSNTVLPILNTLCAVNKWRTMLREQFVSDWYEQEVDSFGNKLRRPADFIDIR